MELWEQQVKAIDMVADSLKVPKDELAEFRVRCAAVDAIPEPIMIHLSPNDWLRIQAHTEHEIDMVWSKTQYELYCYTCDKIIALIEG